LIIIPRKEAVDWFLLSDASCTLQEAVYYFFDHVAWCYTFYFLYHELPSFYNPLRIYFFVLVIDFADFVLTYNSVWFHIGVIPISWNVLQWIFVVYAIIYVNDE